MTFELKSINSTCAGGTWGWYGWDDLGGRLALPASIRAWGRLAEWCWWCLTNSGYPWAGGGWYPGRCRWWGAGCGGKWPDGGYTPPAAAAAAAAAACWGLNSCRRRWGCPTCWGRACCGFDGIAGCWGCTCWGTCPLKTKVKSRIGIWKNTY